MVPNSLNVFTLNCWAIPGISKNRKERIEAIAEYLCESSHNIVCLQEIWSEGDFLILRDNLKAVLPHSNYFYSGVLGSGLCVFTKWPIQDVFFHQWPLNGYIHNIHHGDWFGGKGVGLCRIKYNDRLINVYCTHLHAEYHEDDIYLAHRVLQAHSTAEFVKLTKDGADVSILAGDFNTAPGELSYRLLTELPSLVDPFYLDCQCEDPSIKRATGTCHNANNSYSNQKLTAKYPEGKRIDHILFYTNCSGIGNVLAKCQKVLVTGVYVDVAKELCQDCGKWHDGIIFAYMIQVPLPLGYRMFVPYDTLQAQVINFGNPLKETVPGKPFSYSDHNAVCLELRIEPSKGDISNKLISKESSLHLAIEEAINVCDEARVTITRARKIYLAIGIVLFMFLLGTMGFWNNNLLYDIVKIIFTGLCFYSLVMGTLWNQIEMNSLKAGLGALAYSKRTRETDQ